MDLIVGLRNFLLGQSAIAALVGPRIYVPRLPEKAVYPAIRLTVISEVDGLHTRGPLGNPTDRVQIDSWAPLRDAAVALGRLVRQRLHGYSGVWSDTSQAPPTPLRVALVAYDGGSERFDEEIAGGLNRHTADYLISWTDPDDRILI